jgi:hypothetical protein
MRGSLVKRLPWLAACIAFVFGVSSAPTAAQQVKFINTDPQQVGLAEPGALGLSADLWQGSTRASLGEAIDSVSGATSVTAIHRALRDLLTASAAPPAGEVVTPFLISRRVAALGRLGASDSVMALAALAPAEFRDAPLLNAEANTRLVRFDLAGACNLTLTATSQSSLPEWQRLRAFCRHIFGQGAEAVVAAILAEELALELRAPPDDVFGALFLALQYPNRERPVGLVPTQALHLAMFRYQRLPIAPNQNLPPVPANVMAGLASNPSLPVGVRLQASEQAVSANAGAVEPLIQLYLETSAPGGIGAAYRAAAFAGSVQQRISGLRTLWATTQDRRLLPQLAPYTLGTIRGLDLAAVPPSFTRGALKAALLAGDEAAISNWQDAQAALALLPDGAHERDTTYPLLALAGRPTPPVTEWWPAWVAAAKPTDAQQQLVGGALGALGGESFALAPSPKLKKTKAIRPILAAEAKAPGETALRALALLAAAPEPDAALQVLAIRTLARVHLGHARALALELAVDAGL